MADSTAQVIHDLQTVTADVQTIIKILEHHSLITRNQKNEIEYPQHKLSTELVSVNTRLKAIEDQEIGGTIQKIDDAFMVADKFVDQMRSEIDGLTETMKAAIGEIHRSNSEAATQKKVIDLIAQDSDQMKNKIVAVIDDANMRFAEIDQLYMDASQNVMGSSTAQIDAKIHHVIGEIQKVEVRNREEIDKLKSEVEHNKISDRHTSGGKQGQKDQGFSKAILEYRSIQEIKEIADERGGWRDWTEKFKNAFNQARHGGRDIINWMEKVVIDSNTKENSEGIAALFQETCSREEYEEQRFEIDYDTACDDLFAVMIAKTKGEALKRVREATEGDGLVAYCKVHKWMTEMSMMGIVERTRKLMTPRAAKSDEEIADTIEKWEEEFRYIEKVTKKEPMSEICKVQAIIDMLPDKLRIELEPKCLSGTPDYDKARRIIMNYATRKRMERNRKTKGCAMDCDEVNVAQVNEDCKTCNGEKRFDDYSEEDWRLFAINIFNKGKGKGKGKGEKGDGKGYGLTTFYGTCHHCGRPGHPKSRCPDLGKGFQGVCNNCGIKGHSAKQCPKGQEKGDKGKGKGKKGSYKGKGKGYSQINEIDSGGWSSGWNNEEEKEWGYSKGDPWGKNGELPAYTVQDYCNDTIDLGSLEKDDGFQIVKKNKGAKMEMIKAPPGLSKIKTSCRFRALQGIEEENENEIGDNDMIIPLLACDSEENRVERNNKARKDWKIQEVAWTLVKATVDSGAVNNVAPNTIADKIPVTASEKSRSGVRYRVANGVIIQNEGEKKCVGIGETGNRVSMTYQIADVTKPLLSVYEMNRQGKKVVFDGHNSYIEDKKTGRREWIKCERGQFILNVWMKDGDKIGGENDMEVDCESDKDKVGITEDFIRQDKRFW